MIGKGVYTLTEAARLTGIPVQTARSWFIGSPARPSSGPIFRSEYDLVEGDYAISFLNLIEAHVARRFREEGVKKNIIRRAHETLQQELNICHPFAHADLATNGEAIIIEKGDDELIDVISRQQFFPKMNLGRITYGKESRLAESWGIASGVRIASAINFGKPVIENTSISTQVVAEQYLANLKNADLVARLFRITPSSVIKAHEFEYRLGRVAA